MGFEKAPDFDLGRPPESERLPPDADFPAAGFPAPNDVFGRPNDFGPEVLFPRPKAPGSEDDFPRKGATGRPGFAPKFERPADAGR